MNENEKILSELRQNNRLLKLLILISISGNEYKVSDKSILHGLECLNRSHSASAMFEKRSPIFSLTTLIFKKIGRLF